MHRSPFRGFSVEFTEHRAYQAGDELKYLDWRMLGRSDRLFVKQFEEETNLRSMVLVDASRSMAWQGSPERLTKRAYADRLAAALALILLRQRDATGLVTFDEEVRQLIPARVKAGQWTRIVRGLLDTPDGQGTAAHAALQRLTALRARRGMVVLLSAHGPSGDRAQWSARSAVQGSRIIGRGRGPAACAGAGVRGHGAARDRCV